MSDKFEIVMPTGCVDCHPECRGKSNGQPVSTRKQGQKIKPSSELTIGVVLEKRDGWRFNPTLIQWGRSRKGWPTPEAAVAHILRHFADRGAFMRVRAPKS